MGREHIELWSSLTSANEDVEVGRGQRTWRIRRFGLPLHYELYTYITGLIENVHSTT